MKHNSLNLQLSLIVPQIILFVISLLTLRSVAIDSFNNQLVMAIIALILMFLIKRLDYQLYLFSPWPWYFLSLFLLFITLVFGNSVRGATRWINFFGGSLQTSEIVKPLLVLFIAIYLTQYFPTHITQLLRYLGFIAIPAFLVFIQPDLGTALVIFFIGASGLMAAGVPLKRLLVMFFVFLLLLPVFFVALKPYQRQRLESYFNTRDDPLGTGYNALQAQIAVGSGQFIGRGLGQGTQSHLRFLPERHTDFIFASVVEELGFMGGIIILICYLVLGLGLIRTARQANTETGSIICLCTLALLIAQLGVNIGMNMGLIPITGITLPLLSSGGSSLISFGVLFGIVLSIAATPQTVKSQLEIR